MIYSLVEQSFVDFFPVAIISQTISPSFTEYFDIYEINGMIFIVSLSADPR